MRDLDSLDSRLRMHLQDAVEGPRVPPVPWAQISHQANGRRHTWLGSPILCKLSYGALVGGLAALLVAMPWIRAELDGSASPLMGLVGSKISWQGHAYDLAWPLASAEVGKRLGTARLTRGSLGTITFGVYEVLRPQSAAPIDVAFKAMSGPWAGRTYEGTIDLFPSSVLHEWLMHLSGHLQ